MNFKSDKTNQYLRAMVLENGEEGRMRAIQALGHGNGVGSEATISRLLLASLGSSPAAAQRGAIPAHNDIDGKSITPTLLGRIAEPLQESANDSFHANLETRSAS